MASSSSAAKFEPDTWDAVFINGNIVTMGRPDGYGIVYDGAIAVSNGKIAWLGEMKDLLNRVGGVEGFQSLIGTTNHVRDCKGAMVTPGLVECHSHIVFGGDRSEEWELKLAGASYEEVAQKGGGIVNTVEGTRSATVQELVRSAVPRVEAMLKEGVTCLEVKSGYGLDQDTERKMLLAAREIGKMFRLTVKTTFLGAHALPREYKERGERASDDYIDEVVNMMPALVEEGLADMVDVFCETIAFSAQQTQKVFDEGKRLGLKLRLHGDQLHDFGCGSLAASNGALSCDHCEYTSKQGLKDMAKADTVAVILPSANYFIREKKKPDVEQMRASGVKMAIGTNCNPGSSPCCSLLLCMNMACTLMGLSPLEALQGTTRHAAQAMGVLDTHGSLEVGKAADICLWRLKHPRELSYYLGLNRLEACYVAGTLRP